MVSPSTLVFLAEHGFDWNHLVRAGIPFVPAGVRAARLPSTASQRPLLEEVGDQTDALQAIWRAVRTARGPLAVHNGLLDLVFLYHALVGPLPAHVEVVPRPPRARARRPTL
jgi:target of EGR1 protein 1